MFEQKLNLGKKHYLSLVVLFCLANTSFAQEFELDENLFDLEFVEAGETADNNDAHWYDPFTYRLSYQTITQLNTHNNKNAFGQVVEEQPELENNRLNFLVKYQQAFAPGWLLQGNAQAKLYARQDYEYEANNDNTHIEARINELFIQHSFGDNSIKFGNQTVVWGEAAGNSVLDVINTTELRDLSVVNIEDARLNQMMVVWDYFQQDSQWSSFVNLYPQFDPAVKQGSPLYVPGFKQVDLDRDKNLFEIGSQFRWTRTGSDFAIMAAYLYENELRYDPPPGFVGNAIPIENDYWLLGFSANRAIDKLLLIADVAYSHGILADTVDPLLAQINPLVAFSRHQNNSIGTSLGLEYGISAQQQITFSIRADTYLDQDKAEPGQELINDDVYGSYLLRYSNTSTTGDFAFTSSFQSAMDGSFFLGSVGVNYTVNDNWAMFSQLVFSNSEGEISSNFDDDLRFEFTVHFSF